MRRLLDVVIAITPWGLWVVWVALLVLHSALQRQGLLNTLDVPPIGSDPGGFMEYLLNVWVWDGMMLVSFCLAFLAALLWAVLRGRERPGAASAFEVIEMPAGFTARTGDNAEENAPGKT